MITFKKKKDKGYKLFGRGTKRFKSFEGNHLSMSKGIGWGHITWTKGNMRRFLLANVGRPIDKVFSEYLERCESSVYDAKERFFSYIEKKEDISRFGGFYVSNGILNHKKRRKYKPSSTEPNPEHVAYNKRNMPSNKEVMNLCMKAKSTKEMVFLGKFYVKKPHGKVRLAGVYLSPSQVGHYKTSAGNVAILGYGNGVSLVSEWYGIKEVIKLKFGNLYGYYWTSDTLEFITL